MVTTKREASTLPESQPRHLTEIWHRAYSYFAFQDNPPMATQPIGLFSTEAPTNYLIQFATDTESAAIFLTPTPNQQYLSYQSDDPLFEKIRPVFYIIPALTQPYSYRELFDTLSSYVAQIPSGDLQTQQTAISLLDAYRHQEFDTDISSEFTSDLDTFVQTNGQAAISIISNLMNSQLFNVNIISETLKALGRIESESTKEQRYHLLMRFVNHDSAIIRDAAVSGLSFLDDNRALRQLYMLLETETVPILKNNIQVAINSLELSE
jgi:hypothetical protein